MPQPADYQTEILREVGDPNGTLAPIIGTLWSFAAPYAPIHPSLQYLYTKRSALDVRLAEEQPNTDLNVEGEIADSQAQRFAHIKQMRDDTQAEIVRVTAVARSRHVSVSAALTKVAPTSPPFPDAPDRNDSFYQGDPYRSRAERW